MRKGEIACNKQFLLFSQCFLPYMTLHFHFQCTLKCCLQFVSIWTSLTIYRLVLGLKEEVKFLNSLRHTYMFLYVSTGDKLSIVFFLCKDLSSSNINRFGTFKICMACNAVFNIISVYPSGQCTYPSFPGVLFTSTLHNILSKPLDRFPHNHHEDNG